MLLDAVLPPTRLNDITEIARSAEDIGFYGLWSTETSHDPFLPGALIAENTANIQFGTSIAVAFSRSPATLAQTAWDLADQSEGRFILGLGTQVKAHIERRFGCDWPPSVLGKFREQIQAIRSFWYTWQTGARLNFRGRYYKLTLMTPFFNPGPIEYPDIPIFIAGVNTGLAGLAGEIADGFFVHPFHTVDYVENILLESIREGAEKANRSSREITISISAFVATNPEEVEFVRSQIAFYASTPSYRSVMQIHGWVGTAVELSKLAAHGRWGEMPVLISDQMLEKFAVVGSEVDLPEALKDRYVGLADRLTLYVPFVPGERDDFWTRCVTIVNGT